MTEESGLFLLPSFPLGQDGPAQVPCPVLRHTLADADLHEAAEWRGRVTAMDPDYPEAWLGRENARLNHCAGTGTGRTDNDRDDTRDKRHCGAYPWKTGRSTS